MTDYICKLQPGHVYHVYGRANGNDILFSNSENYRYFLGKYKRYILPIADTYSYCLMPNHYHFLIQFKEGVDLNHHNQANDGDISIFFFEFVFKSV
jgi:putative transposase